MSTNSNPDPINDVHEVRGRVTALERSMEEMADMVTGLGRETRAGFDRITTLIDSASKQNAAEIRAIERNSAEQSKPNWAAWGVIVTIAIVALGWYTASTTKPTEEAIRVETQMRREADEQSQRQRSELIEKNAELRERIVKLETIRELWQEGKLK